MRRVRIVETSRCQVVVRGDAGGNGGRQVMSRHHDVADAIAAGVNLLLQGEVPRVMVEVRVALERQE